MPEIWRIRAQPNQNWTQRAWLHVALRSPPDFQSRICLPRNQDYSEYQSACGDHRVQERHRVEVHWWRHAEQTPPSEAQGQPAPGTRNPPSASDTSKLLSVFDRAAMGGRGGVQFPRLPSTKFGRRCVFDQPRTLVNANSLWVKNASEARYADAAPFDDCHAHVGY